MTQPSGRVCAFSAHLRTWLRSSPIVCIVDALSLLFRIGVQTLRTRSLKLAAEVSLTQRFNSVESFSELQAMEKFPIYRWALIVLPAIFQALKLFGAKIIPWSQGWMYCYVFGFVILEICYILPFLGGFI